MPIQSPHPTAWLAANRRLACLLTVSVILLVLLTGIAAVAVWRGADSSAAALWIVAAGAALSLPIGGVAAAAWKPRLLQSGEQLVVYLGPGCRESLPLSVVEVFFLGSQPLDHRGEHAAAGEAAFRVGTLVVRVAERATDINSRTTKGRWAAWENGYLIIDGRWTEPLTVETVRRINGRLMVAKRAETSPEQLGTPASEGCCQ